MIAHVSHEGLNIHPSLRPGASRLLERADQHHPLGREALERARPLVGQLAVVVVLDDQRLVRRRPLDQRGTPLAAQDGAGRELVAGRDDDDADAVERVDAQALLVDGHRHDLEPRLLDREPVRVPARVLDRDALGALPAQPPAERREAGAEAAAHDHVLGVGGGAAHPRELRGERLAQLRHAARVGLAERRERRRTDRRPDRAQPRVGGKAGQVGNARPQVVGEAGSSERAGSRGRWRCTAAATRTGAPWRMAR